jgi:hypothetical protein
MHAYITISNANKIVFDVNLDDIDTTEEIYKIEFKWFSKVEIKKLLSLKLLFLNPDDFFKKYEKRKPVDKKEFVFEGYLPSYHKYPDCERLLSHFKNHRIPEEIKIKGDIAILEYRNWFQSNMHLMDGKTDLFFDKLKTKFALSERPVQVNYNNSGSENFDNLDLSALEKRIDDVISKANEYYSSDVSYKIILDRFGKASFLYKNKKEPSDNDTDFSNEEIWAVLKVFDEKYKSPLTFLLREYYRVKYNPELKFDGHLLEQLGFQPCTCFSTSYIRSTGQD